MKGKILSIRIGEDLHQKAIKVSTQQGQKLSEFIRNTIDHACNTASYETSYKTEQNQSATEAIQSELNVKNQQIERLQSALDQSQQLQALTESRHQAEQQQLSEMKSRSVLQPAGPYFVRFRGN